MTSYKVAAKGKLGCLEETGRSAPLRRTVKYRGHRTERDKRNRSKEVQGSP